MAIMVKYTTDIKQLFHEGITKAEDNGILPKRLKTYCSTRSVYYIIYSSLLFFFIILLYYSSLLLYFTIIVILLIVIQILLLGGILSIS